MNTKTKGRLAEDYAEKHLKMNGYKIIQRNYNTKYGEIDIIASQREYLVFVEVKMRKSALFGTPAQAVTYQKQNRLKYAADHYLMSADYDGAIRFDVVEIVGCIVDDKLKVESIGVITNAFI